MLSGGAAIATAPLLQSCTGSNDRVHADAARATWHHTEGQLRDALALQRDLVRYATLAPSSHNTQCWRFGLGEGRISVFPDLSRRCPAVDPDDHHLYVSLGCAVENLVQAAAAKGLRGEASFDVSADVVNVALSPMTPFRSALFDAIPQRQCTRAEYDGKPVSTGDVTLLERAGTGEGVRIVIFTEPRRMEQILEYVMRGNSSQMADAAFMAELKTWVRFNGRDAVEAGDGLYSAASGNPTVPRWLGSTFMSVLLSAKSENVKYAAQIRSSSGVAVLVSTASDKTHWVEAGRCYERFALQATALGMRNAMLNQPVEVTTLRPEFASYLGLTSERPDLVVRFGYGPETPRSLRRAVNAVLI